MMLTTRKAHEAGMRACREQRGVGANPYNDGYEYYWFWLMGWWRAFTLMRGAANDL